MLHTSYDNFFMWKFLCKTIMEFLTKKLYEIMPILFFFKYYALSLLCYNCTFFRKIANYNNYVNNKFWFSSNYSWKFKIILDQFTLKHNLFLLSTAKD